MVPASPFAYSCFTFLIFCWQMGGLCGNGMGGAFKVKRSPPLKSFLFSVTCLAGTFPINFLPQRKWFFSPFSFLWVSGWRGCRKFSKAKEIFSSGHAHVRCTSAVLSDRKCAIFLPLRKGTCTFVQFPRERRRKLTVPILRYVPLSHGSFACTVAVW